MDKRVRGMLEVEEKEEESSTTTTATTTTTTTTTSSYDYYYTSLPVVGLVVGLTVVGCPVGAREGTVIDGKDRWMDTIMMPS